MTSYIHAMTSYIHAMTSYIHAMTSYIHAMTSYIHAMTSYIHAMTSYILLVSLYDPVNRCGISVSQKNHGYVPFVVITSQSFPYSYYRACNKSKAAGVTGTTYPSGTPGIFSILI